MRRRDQIPRAPRSDAANTASIVVEGPELGRLVPVATVVLVEPVVVPPADVKP